jgi:uncharacterized phage protein (TIGR01671 family)
MRDILFRGKGIHTGNWAEGNLNTYEGDMRKTYTFISNQYAGSIEVIPETVGQFTGLCDKNGKQIFEGDILQIRNDPYCENPFSSFVIAYGIYRKTNSSPTEIIGFYLYWTSDKEEYHKFHNLKWWIEEREAVCIGNIHDNPELLKGE